MRVELAEKEKLELARQVAREKFEPFLWHFPVDQRDQYWGRIEVLYQSFYAYEELLAVFGDAPFQSNSLLASMETITGYLTDETVVKAGSMTQQKTQEVLLRYARQPKARAVGAQDARRLRVFLCHSSADKPVVRDLYRRLQADGFAPWLDEQELLPGQQWMEQILAAVIGCDAVIICLSQRSVTKEGYLQKEIREVLYAAEEKPESSILIVPLRLDDVEVPRSLSQWQWADLFREGGYSRLIGALTARANALGLTLVSETEARGPSLCMGCMREKGFADSCPYCGWREGTPAESPLQLPPRTVLNGRYMLGRLLGQGGFGITYLAWDLNRGQKLAIKEFFPLAVSTRTADRLTASPVTAKYKAEFQYGLSKFAEEGQRLARFKDQPGIVSVLDLFSANGTAYIVMEYLEGRTFKHYLGESGGRISFDAALKILTRVMNALEKVHSAGMLHHDISPDSVFVEENGQTKILDFGATRYAVGEQSQSLSVILKPGYAPEEQYRTKGHAGPWTDVYALGATFYRAIAGNPPADAMDRLGQDELIPPSRLGIKMPSGSEAALLKALAIRAESRFRSVAEFRSAIGLSSQIGVSSKRAPRTLWERLIHSVGPSKSR